MGIALLGRIVRVVERFGFGGDLSPCILVLAGEVYGGISIGIRSVRVGSGGEEGLHAGERSPTGGQVKRGMAFIIDQVRLSAEFQEQAYRCQVAPITVYGLVKRSISLRVSGVERDSGGDERAYDPFTGDVDFRIGILALPADPV